MAATAATAIPVDIAAAATAVRSERHHRARDVLKIVMGGFLLGADVVAGRAAERCRQITGALPRIQGHPCDRRLACGNLGRNS
ncbi:hypothetical protein Ate01nite_63500 [Actinoplanes teichomyceticus]|nr:hypothetical protein Ate01nite_63500 [Actinoplanes teichomyceticus]